MNGWMDEWMDGWMDGLLRNGLNRAYCSVSAARLKCQF